MGNPDHVLLRKLGADEIIEPNDSFIDFNYLDSQFDIHSARRYYSDKNRVKADDLLERNNSPESESIYRRVDIPDWQLVGEVIPPPENDNQLLWIRYENTILGDGFHTPKHIDKDPLIDREKEDTNISPEGYYWHVSKRIHLYYGKDAKYLIINHPPCI